MNENIENIYGTPEELKKRKQKYKKNINKADQTVWGFNIEEVEIEFQSLSNRLSTHLDIDKKHMVKLGQLYFFAKNESSPEYSYTTKEIIKFLLDGDIGCVIDENIVQYGCNHLPDNKNIDDQLDYYLLAEIVAAPKDNQGEWDVKFRRVGSNTTGNSGVSEIVNPFNMT